MRIDADEIRTFLRCRKQFALMHSAPLPSDALDAMVPLYTYSERLLKATRHVLANAHKPDVNEVSLREYWSSLWSGTDPRRYPRALKHVLIQGYRRLLRTYRLLHRTPYQVIAAGIRHETTLQQHTIQIYLDVVRETKAGIELVVAADLGQVPKFVFDRDPIIGLQALAVEEVFRVRRLPIRVFSVDGAFVGLTWRDGRSLQRLKALVARILDEMERAVSIPHFGPHCARCPVRAACLKEYPR